MSVVLMVEPDASQANLLRTMQKNLGADLVLVQSTDEAIDAIGRVVPDVLLLSALLSPRDEDRLMTYLRSLDGASHLQTLTIPQLRKSSGRTSSGGAKKGVFGFGKKKSTAATPAGCDPAVFAEEVATHLARAAELRNRPTRPQAPILINTPTAEETTNADAFTWSPSPAVASDQFVSTDQQEQEPAESSSVADPWSTERFTASPVNPEIQAPAADPWATERFTAAPVNPEPAIDPWATERFAASPVNAEPILNTEQPVTDELDTLARELGMSLEVQNEESAERMAAEVALVKAETEAKLAAELERVRAEADARRLAELARLQADADALREAAIAEARAAAEEDTRRALASEVMRVRSETEGTVAEAVNRVKFEAEQALSQEIGRAREDAEVLRADLARAQEEAAETARQLEAEVARVRAQAEEHMKAELERIAKDAERARAADQTHAKATADHIRESAAQEARAIAEESARRTLEAEIARVRSQADTILETELARVRAEAQELQAVQLLDLRAQMAEMREAAAEQARKVAEEARAAAAEQARKVAEEARAAAAEQARKVAEEARAVAAEQARAAAEEARAAAEMARAAAARAAADEARAAAEMAKAASARRPAEVISFPAANDPSQFQSPYEPQYEPVEVAQVVEPPRHVAAERRDYYSLWQKDAGVDGNHDQGDEESSEETSSLYQYAHLLKWGLPVAASVLLIVMSSSDTVARLASPSAVEKPPKRVVTEVVKKDAAVAAKPSKFGTLKVETTPPGAQITLDGESRGETPQTFSNLSPGSHTLVLQSADGTITRHITVKAGQTAIASEAIFAGWLAIFAPIPLEITLNGKSATPTDDGRFMIAPGTYKVEMTNTRYNFHRRETFTVRPGGVTAHTVSLPTGALKIVVPDGTSVSVDGQSIGTAPFSEVLPLVVGTHEIKASHPIAGERRTAVDVKFEETAEATFSF